MWSTGLGAGSVEHRAGGWECRAQGGRGDVEHKRGGGCRAQGWGLGV